MIETSDYAVLVGELEAPGRVCVERPGLGSVEGLEDEELLEPWEAERWAILALWEALLVAVPRGGRPGEPWFPERKVEGGS